MQAVYMTTEGFDLIGHARICPPDGFFMADAIDLPNGAAFGHPYAIYDYCVPATIIFEDHRRGHLGKFHFVERARRNRRGNLHTSLKYEHWAPDSHHHTDRASSVIYIFLGPFNSEEFYAHNKLDEI